MSDCQEQPVSEVARSATDGHHTRAEKVKKVRTPAQLETLRLAREKAATVRAQNAEMRRKQTEIDKAAAEEVKKQRVAQLEKEYSAMALPPEVEKGDHETEASESEQKKKPPKKRVVVVEESSSEDEVEIRLPAPKRKPATQTPNPKEERYNNLYKKMFAID